MRNNKGVGIMEIIVATILLAVILVGMTSIFVAGKRHVTYSRSKMAGGELGKQFLDPLQMDVRQNDWDISTNRLYLPSGLDDRTWTETAPAPINNVTYIPTYTVSRVKDSGTDTGLRRVQLTINWPRISTP